MRIPVQTWVFSHCKCDHRVEHHWTRGMCSITTTTAGKRKDCACKQYRPTIHPIAKRRRHKKAVR